MLGSPSEPHPMPMPMADRSAATTDQRIQDSRVVMNLFGKVGAALMVVVVVSLTMCAIQKRSVYADPNVAPAFERAKLDAQPLIAALAQYYASHAYYPKSLGELPRGDGTLYGFDYEVWSMYRVYNSLDCAAQSKNFTGFVGAIPDYERRLTAFRSACVRGYSNFVLKSPQIRTAWQINSSVVAYAQFASQDARWSVEWCNHRSQPGLSDCRRNAFDESVPIDGSRPVGHIGAIHSAVPDVR
jgi:hypothetical protein